MNTHVFIYDGFVSFEIMLATYLMKTQGEIITVGLNANPVRSYEDFDVVPKVELSQINSDEVSLFIIPGGDHTDLQSNPQLISFLQNLDAKQKCIAAICSAVNLLEHAGILADRQHVGNVGNTDLVRVDKHIITAKPNGYVDFSIEIGKAFNIYADEDDLLETIDFFRNFKG
ncbi:DJ-1/PfpI family protein [Paenibacillus sanguinis]|uniref:DJ-1/PfpI family protein n=1 Tax=Paenibacillus sanguinis TaxID=225906 RepID=UPI000382DFE7|nr:DJ-1/PfpI family protein [Paenibacillus sanguinis]